jgi:hypothetical protein
MSKDEILGCGKEDVSIGMTNFFLDFLIQSYPFVDLAQSRGLGC